MSTFPWAALLTVAVVSAVVAVAVVVLVSLAVVLAPTGGHRPDSEDRPAWGLSLVRSGRRGPVRDGRGGPR